jgi:peroxiredoxin
MKSESINYKPAVIVLLLLIGVAVIVLLKLNESGVIFTNQARLDVGSRAPDFTFPGLDGKLVSLSDHRGKVVLVNIWATWCPPCVDEMPSMQKLYQKLGGKDFEILAVSIDAGGSEVVNSFMQRYKLTFPALVDAEGSIKESYGANGVPESFIIDQQGLLVKKIVGPVDWSAPDVFLFFDNLIRNVAAKNKTSAN